MEQYLKQLYHRLKMKKSEKKKIIDDITSEIQHRVETGEKMEDILNSMGSPIELADEFNENMNISANRKSKKIFVAILYVISICFGVFFIYNFISIFAPKISMQYIIEIVNTGNEVSFLGFKLSLKEVIIKMIIEALIAVFSFALAKFINIKKVTYED